MTEEDEQVKKFIDFLDDDDELDKFLKTVKKTNKFLKNEIAESKKELRCCGNCQSVFDADGFCYLYKDGRCINQSEWKKRSNKKNN